MARTDLTQGNNTANASTYNTASITPGSNRVALAFVMNVRAAGAAVEPTAQGNGLTWKSVASVQVAAAPNRRLTCFRATGATPTQGPLNFNFGAEQQTLCAWSVFEYDGVADVAQVKTSGGGAPTPSISLDPLADANKSIVVGGVIVNSLFGAAAQVQPGQGCTEIHEEDVPELGTGGSLQTEDRTGGGTTINWTAFAQGWAAIALELKAGTGIPGTAPDPASVAALAAQFEPVVFFHSSEKFFPSDAKAYIETMRPVGRGDTIRREGLMGMPLVPKTKINTTDSTAPTYLGLPGNLIDNPGAERFFDLSGWKDAAGMAEPTVTAGSKNTYSDRNAVAALYDSDPTLKASKFRYDAELFDNARLRRLLSADTPDLVKVLDSLSPAHPDMKTKSPALLCYYFFFPAHEEALVASCPNIEAKEFGSFAGEWACMAVLLEQDAPGKPIRPTFIGQTGRRLFPVAGVSLPPLTDDGQDAARRIVMKVNPFAEAASIDGHPTLFVADGTHSLYLRAGTVAVSYPSGMEPWLCGKLDSPSPHELESVAEGLAIFYGKLYAAALLASALGLTVAAALILLEKPKLSSGVDVVGTVPLNGRRARRNRPAWQQQVCAAPDCAGADCASERRRGGPRELAVDSCRTGEPGLVARRVARIGLSGPVGTTGRERPLRQAGRHEIPGLLENVLPRLCYR